MKVVIAPDSFKGCLNAQSVAKAMEQGIRRVDPNIVTKLIPMADGGEGTVEALITALGGELIRTRVTGPLREEVESYFGLLNDKRTAVIELAATAGLNLVPPELRNPLITTTYGFGELIRQALDAGAQKLILGIGGSCTNDGGAGMLEALGVKFLDNKGQNIGLGGGCLADLGKIDVSGLDPRLLNTEVIVACDVINPLCGPEGASAVYGPQKGATSEMVSMLDNNLSHYSDRIFECTGRQVKDIPKTGAAGGVGAGLIAFLNVRLEPGSQVIMDAAGMESVISDADLVITGEGLTDRQTQYGKVPFAVVREAAKYGVPVVCLSGGITEDARLLYNHGFSGVFSITEGPISLNEAIIKAEALLERAAERILRLFLAGRSSGFKV